MVVDGEASGFAGRALDLGATGYGMVLAATMGDEALLAELTEGWTTQWGPPGWGEAGLRFGYSLPGLPVLFQNGFPLLARTSSPASNLGTETLGGVAGTWDAAWFEQPHLVRVGADGAFVNQAIYDAERETLVVTINGGGATSQASELEIAGLDPERRYSVLRDSVLYPTWAWQGERLVVMTPPLRPQEETYLISPAADAPDPSPLPTPMDASTQVHADTGPAQDVEDTGAEGCRLVLGRGSRGPWPSACLMLLGCALLRRGRRAPRRPPGRRPPGRLP